MRVLNIFRVYIPIWLDLLFIKKSKKKYKNSCLHSNMVRFIINKLLAIGNPSEAVYIPIWLDLL